MRRLALAALLALLAWSVPAQGASCLPAIGMALDGYPIDSSRLDQVRAQSGLTPRLVVFFLQWPRPGDKGEIPLGSLEAISTWGALPVVTWEPMYIDAQGKERAIPASNILKGDYDAYLTAFARALGQWGKPVVIRLAHEMNLKRYHWGTIATDYGPQSPALYQKLFRYVVTLVRKHGGDNLRWAFCPNAESQPHPRWDKAAWNTAAAYWPGAGYVDILGMDGYNWGLSRNKKEHGWQSRWLEFAKIYGDLQKELQGLAPDKPLVVFETSCALAGGDREAWLAGALARARQWKLAGLVWFQANKEVDWRLTSGRDQKALDLLVPQAACLTSPVPLLRALGFNPR